MTATHLIVRPRAGLKLRDPKTAKPIDPEKGLPIEHIDTFWQRRLNEGDVMIAEEPVNPPVVAPAPKG